MRNSNENKKGIRLLSFLTLFLFATIYIVGKVRNYGIGSPKISVDDNAAVCTSCNEESSTDNSEYVIYDLNEEEAIDVKELVLSSTSRTSNCEKFQNMFNVRRLCTDGAVPGQLDRGADNGATHNASKSGGDVKLSDEMTIKLVEVTFPAQLANGKKTVKDNRKDILKEDPVYFSFGDAVSVDYSNKFKTPTQVSSQGRDSGLSSDGKEAYMVVAENTITTAVSGESLIGEYTVEKAENERYKSLCTEDIQPSYFNPKPANDSSVDLDAVLQIPGGNPVDAIDNQCLSQGSMTETITDTKVLGYLCRESKIATFIGNIVSFFSNDTWSECNDTKVVELPDGSKQSEDDLCVSEEDIVIEMSSLFGSVDQCEGDVCSNSFLTRRFKSTLTPASVGDYKLVGSSSADSLTQTILTPCKIEVSVSGFFAPKTRELNVYCMWDITPTIMNYRAHQVEKIPAQEDFPQTFEEYWDLVKQTMKKDGEISNGR